MQGVSWIDGSRIKSSDSWNCTENQHIYITFVLDDRKNKSGPKRTKTNRHQKGGKSGAAKLISHPMGTLTTVDKVLGAAK